MSADGRYVAWLTSGAAGNRLVLYDVTARRPSASLPVAARRVRAFTWTHLPGVGIGVADPTGGENWSLYRVRVDTGEWDVLGPPVGAQTRVVRLSPRQPDSVLVATNGRDSRFHDYDLVSLGTGTRRRLLANTGYAAAYFDDEFALRLVETVDDDGARTWWHGDPAGGRRFLHVPHEDALTARILNFSGDGRIAYAVLPGGDDAVRLVGLHCVVDEPATVVETLLTVRRADIDRILVAPETGRPELARVERFRPRTVALAPGLVPALTALRARLGEEPTVLQRHDDGRLWLVAVHRPEVDERYFGYQPHDDALWPLSAARPDRRPLAISCRPVDIPVRDGRRAVAYLTTPKRAASGSAPAVLLVHGGPWRRSRWDYTERRGWLAALGYTVIEPNFRGSTGFGRGWINAGDRQWGAAMQDDLLDALDWAVRRGVCDPDRVGLVGGSYGGYAALQLATAAERPFRCVVATSPVTDLVAFLEAPPPYWRSAVPMMRRRIGDPSDPAQREALADVSPVHHADRIRCPVLLVHGLNDSRLPAEMTTRMFMALANADRDASMALFPDEGHEIVSAANRVAVADLLADFLARHLPAAGFPPVAAVPSEPADSGPAEASPEVDRIPAGSTLKLFHTPRHQRTKADRTIQKVRP
ncbi:alpha/beta fold hydrolase [Micromonospora profundi]|uniref:alpha/beta hydrolase family protein n=1 Tax=Micromonospora profundi TaxID=1420889 RepID=UPI002FF19EA9